MDTILRQQFEFSARLAEARVGGNRLAEGVRGRRPSFGQFEQVTKLEIGISDVRCPLARGNIGGFRPDPIAGFLQDMTELNPQFDARVVAGQ